MVMRMKQWTVEGGAGQPILGDTHLPGGEPVGVILLCHGFKGYKDYGFFPRLADAAAEAGFVAHRFNFSHSGMTNNIETFERPELFERDTWGKQVADLRAVVAAVGSGELAGGGLPQVWFGHSRGGITVTLSAARAFAGGADWAARPAGVVLASSPHRANYYGEEITNDLRERGRYPSPSNRTGQTLYIGKAWLDEIEADPDAFDPVKRIAGIACPILLLHGTADDAVPPASSGMLADAAGGRATLHLMDGAGHTYNAPNPLPDEAGLPSATREMFEHVTGFARGCVTGDG